MASFNKVVLMGNITRNPELRSIPGSNTAVARTGIAVNRKVKDREEVMFIDIVAFGKTAEIMGEYIVKGSPLLLEGRLSFSSWEQEGVKRSKHEVIIETFQMLGGRKERSEFDSTSGSDSMTIKSGDTIDEDDVPF